MATSICLCALCASGNARRQGVWNVNVAVSSTHLSALIVILGGAPIQPVINIQPVDVSTVGTLQNALMAQTIHDASNGYGRNAAMPTGWNYLGGGMSRSVYCGPDGIAYKVQRNEGYCNGGQGANQSEAETFLSLSPLLPAHIRLAPCTVWTNTVSAMVNCGDGLNNYDMYFCNRAVREAKAISAGTSTPLRDLHGGNVRVLDDANGSPVLWLIDYAF